MCIRDSVEVVHVHGPSAHSHFYSAASYQANENGQGHGEYLYGRCEAEESVKHHSMEVGLRTELADVIHYFRHCVYNGLG